MKIRLEANQEFLAFEDYDGGMLSYFSTLRQAKKWAKKRRRLNRKTLTNERKTYLAETVGNIIFVDAVSVDENHEVDIIETVWDCPLF